jgi:hypothetical protein
MERETIMFTRHPSGRLAALAAACLLTVSLPAGVAMAKEKNKKPAAETSSLETEYSVSIPTIDAVDSTIDSAVLTEILSGNIADHADELATLDATSITVPEISVTIETTQDGERQTATLTFTDLVLEDVQDGVAASASLAGSALTADEVSAEFGTLAASSVDFGGILGFYGLVDSEQTELETIYTDFSAAGGSITSEELNCTIGAMSGAEFKARPLNTSFAEMLVIAEGMEETGDDVDPAAMAHFMRMYADLLTAFETSETSFDGLSCDGVDDEGTEISFAIDGMNVGAMSPGLYPSISMDGWTMSVGGEGSMTMDNFTMKPMDLTDTIALLQNVPDTLDDAWFEANARGLFPAMEGFSMSGFSMDIPDPANPDTNIKAGVGSFDLTLGNYINGIPGDLDVSAANITGELPEDSADPTVTQLRDLGVTSIDAGFRIAANWNEADETIDIEEVSVTGVDLATIVLAGTISNATENLFSTDMDVIAAAGLGLAVDSLDVSITDSGLTDIIVAVVAADQGADPASLRPVFAGLAQGTVLSVMAGAADAAKLGEAINRFVSGAASTLDIGITAKSETGIGLADFMAAETDPTSLISKVNVTAEAK